jgi:hypothetical protein
MRDQPRVPRFLATSGRRSIARTFSSGVRKWDVVVARWPRNTRNPKMATGTVIRKSMMNSHLQPAIPSRPS